MSAGRFRVRKSVSGYSGNVSWNVHFLSHHGGRAGRVNVHPYGTRESAHAAADELNIGDGVMPWTDDPRPYAIRLAESRARYIAERAS